MENKRKPSVQDASRREFFGRLMGPPTQALKNVAEATLPERLPVQPLTLAQAPLESRREMLRRVIVPVNEAFDHLRHVFPDNDRPAAKKQVTPKKEGREWTRRRLVVATAAAGALGLLTGKGLSFPDVVRADEGTARTDVGTWYTIQLGDTLSDIAARFGIPQDVLQQMNGISNPDSIFTDTQIWVPSITDLLNSGGIDTSQYIHVIRPGDTLSGIATEYGVTIDSLMANNPIQDQNNIYVGQRLQVIGAQGDDIIPGIVPTQPVLFPYNNKGILEWLANLLPRGQELLIVSGAVDLSALSVSPWGVVILGAGLTAYVGYNIVANTPGVREKLGSAVIGVARGLQSVNDWFYTNGFADPAIGVHPGAREWPEPTSTDVDISHIYEGDYVRFLERVRDYGHLWRLNKPPDRCLESNDKARKILIWNFNTHRLMFIHNLVTPNKSTILNRNESRSLPEDFRGEKESEDCGGSFQYLVDYVSTLIKEGIFKGGGSGPFVAA